MYENPKKWSKRFQLHVIKTMLENHNKITHSKFKIMERSLHSSEKIFSKNLLNCDIIQKEDYEEIVNKCQNLIQENNVKIDLIVYIRTSPEIAFSRVKSSNRFEEEEITLDYMNNIHELYEEYARKCELKLVTIDGNQDTSIKTSVMALRQSVGTILPEIDGLSFLAWNHCILKFKLPTQQCNISNEENILRLNKYLKGEAKSKVNL
uniref:Deoxynucleoside kinase domain-containing protein n=1 Tax=Megaselia scalaris TaxID=36166 RepID=T1GM13_MEGSC